MHESLNSVLEFDHDSDESTDDYTFEIGGIIPILYGLNSYRAGDYGFSNKYSYYTSYEQLCFNGPRVAQYWLANNPDYEDIVMVCNAQENWIWMPDGTNGVADYFNLNYENGRVDYETQVEQSEAWRKPTTPAAVHDSIHYNQIGYNEVGRESVRNALVMLGEKEADDIETTVELLSWDGYTEVEHIEARAAGSSGTLVVPKVYPLWKAKDVTYSLSDGLDWAYYDIIAETKCVNGALSTGTEGKSVVITGHDWSEWETLSEPTEDEVGEEMRTCFACGAVQTRVSEGVWQKYNLADHLAEQPEDICLGINLWDVLEHDEQYFANGTNWGKHASGNLRRIFKERLFNRSRWSDCREYSRLGLQL